MGSGEAIRLADVLQALNEIHEIVADLSRELGGNNARLAAVEKSLDRVHNLLTEGNGRAIVPRVGVIESRLDRIEAAIAELDRTKISGDIEPEKPKSDLERVELARAAADKARWNAIKAYGGWAAGIAALLGMLLKYLLGGK